MISDFFKPEIRDTDYMSDLEAAEHLKPAWAARIMLLAIIALVAFIITWAALAEVDVMTRGSGQVVPSREVQVVQSLEGGILAELMVQEGERVTAGQPLMRISDVQFSSEERGTEARFLGLSLKKARLEAEASGEEFTIPDGLGEQNPNLARNEMELYVSRQKELTNAYDILDKRIEKAEADLSEVQAQINRLAQNRNLLREELEITSEMVRQRAVPKIEEIRLNRELSDIQGQIAANTERKKSLQAELNVARQERDSQADRFRSGALAELSDVETEIAALEESLTAISDRVERTELRSPVEGIVNNIAVKTIGGVIEPAQRLIEIVPVDDELKIIARVSPDEIAFLSPGQPVKVKITAYDPQKYGSLDGELVRIGANSITDRQGDIWFEIEVKTDKNYMGTAQNPLPITPGMVANVEVITGKRTILNYLMKPFLRARDVAFTEQ